MHKFLFIFFPLFSNFFLAAQVVPATKNWGYKGYSGGMFVHSGYVQSKHFAVFDLQGNEIEHQIKGATFGLGGKMSIYLNRFFRTGGEGYFSTCNYGKYKNSCRIGWGGVTFDFLYPVKKWAPFMGFTVGGGSATTHIFLEKRENSREASLTVFFKNPLCILAPAIGVEFFASNRISILFKTDYMLNVYKNQPAYPQGVRFYLGIHFYHKK
jgi:hypothetical protein